MLSIGGITAASWLMMLACMQATIPPVMKLDKLASLAALALIMLVSPELRCRMLGVRRLFALGRINA